MFTLETIVEKFGEEMAPYAVGVCQHLTQAFWRACVRPVLSWLALQRYPVLQLCKGVALHNLPCMVRSVILQPASLEGASTCTSVFNAKSSVSPGQSDAVLSASRQSAPPYNKLH